MSFSKLPGDNPPRLHGLVCDIAAGVLKNLEIEGSGVVAELEHIYATEAPHESDGAANSYEDSDKK